VEIHQVGPRATNLLAQDQPPQIRWDATQNRLLLRVSGHGPHQKHSYEYDVSLSLMDVVAQLRVLLSSQGSQNAPGTTAAGS